MREIAKIRHVRPGWSLQERGGGGEDTILKKKGRGRGGDLFFFFLPSILLFESRRSYDNAIQSAVYRPHRDLVWKQSMGEDCDVFLLFLKSSFKNNP